PDLRAREAVGRPIRARVFFLNARSCGARSEPREDDGDSAADRFTRLKRRLLRNEQHRLRAAWLPCGDVRPLQVELSPAGGRVDVCTDELVMLVELEQAGNGEGCVELIDCLHGCLGPRAAPDCILGHQRIGIGKTGVCMVKAVLCDIDGTLVQSNWLHAEAWQRAFAEMNIVLDRETVRRQLGTGGDELLPVFVPWWKREAVEEPLK